MTLGTTEGLFMRTTTMDLIAYLQRAIAESGVLDPAHEQQDEQHHDNHPEDAGGRVAVPVPAPIRSPKNGE